MWWQWPQKASPTAAAQAPATAGPQGAPRLLLQALPLRGLSIVVLPFTNLSNDPEQEYFVDAITDDLTTDLSRIADSFVIARNTAFTYKGKAVDAKQVSHELSVRYVLEGSVRRMGDQVQVNVQLIDGETGAHVWADRFETIAETLREAQSQITGRLAQALHVELVQDAAGASSGSARSIPMPAISLCAVGPCGTAPLCRQPTRGSTGIRAGARDRPALDRREDRNRIAID